MTTLGKIAREKPNNGIFRKNTDYLSNGLEGTPVVWVKELFEGNSISTNNSRRVIATKKEIEKYGLQKGDILFCRSSLKLDGIAFNNVYLGDSNDALFECHIIRISPNLEEVCPTFVNWMLRTPYLRAVAKAKAKTATMTTIDQQSLASIPICLPPLAEQKRIAGILDAADALRVKRREAIAQLDALLQSTFLTLFGDPVTNPMGWEVEESSNLFSMPPRIGTTIPAAGQGYLVVRVGEVGQSRISFERCGRVEMSEKDFEKFRLEGGDTIIARAIGSKKQLGKASFFNGFREPVVIDSHVMRFRLNPEKCNPVWFYSLISSDRGKILLQRAGGATAVQFNINGKQASSLKIPLPKLDIQNHFATIVKSIEKQKAHQRAHLAELDTLFAALQSRAFNGEL